MIIKRAYQIYSLVRLLRHKQLRNIFLATSVAARGLDVKNLVLVVNFDCPNHYEDYVHRCGRTGRAGNKGWAYTFITEEEAKYAGDIVKGNFNAINLVGTIP